MTALGALSVTHIVPSLSKRHTGVVGAVLGLHSALEAHGLDSRIRSVFAEGEQLEFVHNERIFMHRGLSGKTLRSFKCAPTLVSGVYKDAKAGRLLHTHGLWLFPNFVAGILNVGERHSVIHSIHGMLAPEALQYSKWKKRVAWFGGQKRALDFADCLHATTEQEYREIRACGLRNPVAVVPLGVDVHASPADRRDDNRDGLTLLILGRLHPKKGLLEFLDHWAALEDRFPHWQLKIIGPDDAGYGAVLKDRVRSLGLNRVAFGSAVYGDDKWRMLESADLLVVPSLNENFAMVVSEALAVGLPALVTNKVPWSLLNWEGCGWWGGSVGALEFQQLLLEALSTSREDLRKMGDRGRLLVANQFSWNDCAVRMAQVYGWLGGANQRPEFVCAG